MSRRAPCVVAAAAVMALLCSAGTARAQSSPSVLYACINPGNGVVRVVAESEECKSTETRLQWNVVGEAGPAGPQGPQGPQGATGATGEAGKSGDHGAQGDKGDKGDKGEKGDTGATGATGADGAPGAPGADGAPGVNGADGATGATGLQGTSGIVSTVGFELPTGAVLNTATYVVPGNCLTAQYRAGENEMAFINVGFQGHASGATNFQLLPFFSTNGGMTVMQVGTLPANQSVALNAYGSAHTVATMPLSAGVMYRFGTGVKLHVTANPANQLLDMTCRAVVIIAKLK